jgi:type I site-specific restriction endonuclease
MSKKDLSEADICDRYITPALYEAGWNLSYASILHLERRYSQSLVFDNKELPLGKWNSPIHATVAA